MQTIGLVYFYCSVDGQNTTKQMHEKGEKIKHFTRNTWRERSLERPRRNYEDYSEIDIKESAQ
jgi:hypothetical protein